MKNNKVEFFNIDILKSLKRLPKSISKNEKFEENYTEKLDITDEKLEQLLKEKKYQEAIEYKDLIFKNKLNLNKKTQ